MVKTLNAHLESLGIPPQAGYTFQELASIFGVTEQSIRLYVKQGKLRAWKTSPRKWGKVPHAEAERFLLASNAPKLAHVDYNGMQSVPEEMKAEPFTTSDALLVLYPPAHDYVGIRAEEAERMVIALLLSEGFSLEGEGTDLKWHWRSVQVPEEAS